MYSIQEGQQLLNKTSMNEGQEIIPSDYLTLFPIELIVQIFQELTTFRDFCSFTLTSKFFYLIGSQHSQAVNCPELLPYSFTHHANASLHQLPVWKKIELATQIEKKLFSSDILQPILQKELFMRYKVWFAPFNTTIIEDHLILTSASLKQGMIYLYHLKTNSQHSFKADEAAITLCMAIHILSPLLVTANRQGFKIWNFNLIKSENYMQALLFQKDDKIACSEFNPVSDQMEKGLIEKIPVIAVSNHLLGVGYSYQVLIFDCTQLFESPLYIAFENVKQIEFFEEHLMLISDNQVAIWSLSAVLNSLEQGAEEKILTLEFATFTYILMDSDFYRKNPTIAFAKVHQEKLVIAYQDGYVKREKKRKTDYFQVGEVLNWKTGQPLRALAYKCNSSYYTNEFNSMDFQGRFLFTASHFLCKWDLDDIQMRFPKSIDKTSCCLTHQCAFKVYSIGTHVLFVYNRLFLIKKAIDFCAEIKTEGPCFPFKAFHPSNPPILAFDFKGIYLITIVRNKETEEEDFGDEFKGNKIFLTVYDFSQTTDQMEQKI